MRKNIIQSKYTLEEIFKNQKADFSTKRFFLTFHDDLMQQLNQESLEWIARTHIRGVTYLCNSEKAFMFVDVRQKFLSIKVFTGDSMIKGLGKANWVNRGDNRGSKIHRIKDKASLDQEVKFAVAANKIAFNWTKKV